MSGAKGRRAARLPTQGDRLARRTVGLEGVLVDNDPMEILPLERGDDRSFAILVAGPSALLVAKLTKIAERQGQGRYVNDKDAIDVVRLLRAASMERLAGGLAQLLTDPQSADVSRQSLQHLRDLFGAEGGAGVGMAVRGLEALELPEMAIASTTPLSGDLLRAVGERSSHGDSRK